MEINIGIAENNRKLISDKLSRILANEYFLYLKTLNFHWNITGESFIGLHQLLESHYEWLKLTVDEIAERIRTLGYTAPGSYKNFLKEHVNISDGDENQTAQAMLAELVKNHEAIIVEIRNIIKAIQGLDDYATEDMLIDWLKAHEKNTWMLRSHLLHKPTV